MTENQRIGLSTMRHGPKQAIDNAVVLRVPKPNLQIIILGLIAIITLFQTFQLIRISSKAGSAKAVSPATINTNGGTGAGSNTDVPQSMVGGC